MTDSKKQLRERKLLRLLFCCIANCTCARYNDGNLPDENGMIVCGTGENRRKG